MGERSPTTGQESRRVQRRGGERGEGEEEGERPQRRGEIETNSVEGETEKGETTTAEQSSGGN